MTNFVRWTFATVLHISRRFYALLARFSFGPEKGAPMRTTLLVAITSLTVTGCTSALENPVTLFADPGKYEFHNCEQLAKQRQTAKTREQELKELMDRAEQGTGGAFVNVIAYKSDYVAVTEELKVIEGTMRVKKCSTQENWGSTSAIR